jgi:hypothetical protein
MNRRAFIVERPLQIMISLAISNQLDNECGVDFLVADCFHDAENIYNRLSTEFKDRFSFRYFATYKNAVDHCSTHLYSEVFIHWDIGFGTNIRLKRLLAKSPETSISVYEEGMGTYADYRYPALKKWIFNSLGLPVNNGGNHLTKNIYVYHPAEYQKNVTKPAPIIEKIKTSLPELISQFSRELCEAFDPDDFLTALRTQHTEKCVIYLSDWSFENHHLLGVKASQATRVLKLHPYVKTEFTPTNGFLVAPNSLPAEILITHASEIFQSVEVIHQGSSVMRYIHRPNVEYRRASA